MQCGDDSVRGDQRYANGRWLPNTPGIWSDEQVAGWRKITDSVHAAGSIMLLQLWHVGRISDPVYLDGAVPVGPERDRRRGARQSNSAGEAVVTPRALGLEELPE